MDGLNLDSVDSEDAVISAAPAGCSVGDEVMEEVPVRARRPPKEPTELERIKHEATHIPYRSWCQHCIRGRGRNKPHLRKKEEDP